MPNRIAIVKCLIKKLKRHENNSNNFDFFTFS